MGHTEPSTSPSLPGPRTEMSDINVLNFDMAFKVAFASFFRLGELVYPAAEMRNALTFQNTKITRQDVRFFEKGQYATIPLKRSKTDYDHRGITIVLIASHDSICPVAALQSLMERDPQPESAPLFRLTNGAFTRDAVIKELENRLLIRGISPDGYRDHSFPKGAAQEAHNNGLTQQEIQMLGRWSSDAVHRYYKTNRKRVIQLHKQFQLASVKPPLLLLTSLTTPIPTSPRLLPTPPSCLGGHFGSFHTQSALLGWSAA
jgi:hypothetical protein